MVAARYPFPVHEKIYCAAGGLSVAGEGYPNVHGNNNHYLPANAYDNRLCKHHD
jgi:hypothetical protein